MKRWAPCLIVLLGAHVAHADWSAKTLDTALHWQQNEEASEGSRTGTTPDNFSYAIERDGSGSIKQILPDPRELGAVWYFECPVDAMTDKRNCVIRAGSLVIGFSADKPAILCLTNHDFPGKHGMIRIDRSTPILTDQRGCVLWSQISGLAKADTLTVRSYKFPYDSPHDSKETLLGLASAISLTSFVYRNIDHLTF